MQIKDLSKEEIDVLNGDIASLRRHRMILSESKDRNMRIYTRKTIDVLSDNLRDHGITV